MLFDNNILAELKTGRAILEEVAAKLETQVRDMEQLHYCLTNCYLRVIFFSMAIDLASPNLAV